MLVNSHHALVVSTGEAFTGEGCIERKKSASSAIKVATDSLKGIQIGEYTDLFRFKKIEVFVSPQGEMHATLNILDKSGTCVDRICGLPVILSAQHQKRSLSDLQAYFNDGPRMTPEKGVSGEYNRVVVDTKANGGYKPKIPFQPGLSLGSIVKLDNLVEMEKYAEVHARRENFEAQVQHAEKQIEFLTDKIAVINDKIKKAKVVPLKDAYEALRKAWELQIKNLTDNIVILSKELTDDPLGAIPVFRGFQQAAETPIDFSASRMEDQVRGFDSLEFNSQYIWLDKSTEEIHDQITQSSSSRSISAKASYGIFVSGSASFSWAKAAADRVGQIKKEGIAEGVLVINASTTTRHVRTFTDVKYDHQKLQAILDAMNAGSDEVKKIYGISNTGTEDAIYLLTDAVLGGGFTALVTVLDQNKMKRDFDKRLEEKQSAAGASLGGGWSLFSASANFQSSSGSAAQSENDKVANFATTKINIEIFSEGAIPNFNRHLMQKEIMKHINLNPAAFEISMRDEEEANDLVNAKSAQDKLKANIKREMRMQNAGVAAMNACRGLTSETKSQNVHTLESVLEAYESFTEQMKDKDCGVPVGFNYRILTKSAIEKILNVNQAVNLAGPAN